MHLHTCPDRGVWHGEAGIDLITLGKEVLAVDKDFQSTADTQRSREVPKPEVLCRRAVLSSVQAINPLQSTMQCEASRLPVGSLEEFMLWCGSERTTGMKEAVVGI